MKIHVAIAIGLIAGLLLGVAASATQIPFLMDLAIGVAPIGTAFVNLLRMVVIPLVAATLFVGVAGLGDLRKLGRLGLLTMLFFAGTTVVSILLGMGTMPDIPDRRPAIGPFGLGFDRYLDFDYSNRSIRSIAFAATEALRDADTAVHSLSTAPLGRFGLHVLWYLTDETGGTRQYHTHHLEKQVAKIEKLTSHFYIIGYRRWPNDPEGVNIRVAVDRRDVKVFAPTRLALPPRPEQVVPQTFCGT